MSTQRNASIELALKEYEAERLPPTAGIVLRNRLNGPEQVMQIAHERAPEGYTHIHDVVPEQELAEIAARYKRLAGFDRARSEEHTSELQTLMLISYAVFCLKKTKITQLKR